jgi:predicted metal-dependent hydrolase
MSRRAPRARDVGQVGQLSLWSEAPEERWRVRVSARAHRMTIRVFAGGHVEIVVPGWARARAIERFVRQHRDWVERKIAELGTEHASCALPPELALAAIGERWFVHYHSGVGEPRLVAAGPGVLEMSGNLTRDTAIRGVLREWLMERARQTLAPWVLRLSEDTGLAIARVQVRRQRTRWGSCSRSGTVSLNCCLLFQTARVVNYLLLHELCHTRHMNHSARFWRLVEKHERDYRALDAELVRGWRNVPGWVFEP